MRLVDTHCHLNFKSFDDDFIEVATASRGKGVDNLIIVGSDPDTSLEAIKRAREINSQIQGFAYVAIGIHAVHTDRGKFEDIKALASDPLVEAIGETGIDFYHDKDRKTEQAQIDLFKKHIELAIEFEKPLIIHNREADERVREVIENYPDLKKAVLHCFSADHHMAAWAVERGFYLSFTGNITYGNKKIKKAIERTPIERIMVETDAPYMVPEPLRSEGIKKCEPWMCAEVVKKIALIKNLDLESVGEQIYNNSKSFFGL
jgi:TatD DNase family protein